MAEAALEHPTRLSRWLTLMASLRHPKTGYVLLFGFASGLPYALLLGTLYAWLTDAKVDVETMGDRLAQAGKRLAARRLGLRANRPPEGSRCTEGRRTQGEAHAEASVWRHGRGAVADRFRRHRRQPDHYAGGQ